MTTRDTVSRRNFFRKILGSALVAGIAGKQSPLEAIAQIRPSAASLPSRVLGKTGHRVSLLSLGGQATLEEEGRDDDAVAIINRAIDLGVNYLDTAPRYGPSEIYLGSVLKTRRKEVFLASKTHDRTYDGSMRLLEKSLKRLQTDHLDLWQLHNVRTQDDIDFIFAREGAIHALEKAREQGAVRYLGITGHRDPIVLRNGIERYPFDTILMALNAAEKHEASFIDQLLPAAVERKMGIIAMKVVARGKIFHERGLSTMEQAVRYVLTLPVSTALIGISTLKELEENVRIARDFRPYTTEDMANLEALTGSYFADATWYKQLW